MSKHVIIAGAGPCGLLVALGLAQAGSRVTVLEEAEELNDSPRAIWWGRHWVPRENETTVGVLEGLNTTPWPVRQLSGPQGLWVVLASCCL